MKMSDYNEKNVMKDCTKRINEISRRRFLKRSVVTLAGISTLGLASAIGSSKTKDTLRVIAYNVYGCTGWPRNHKMAQKANREGQMPARIAQELTLYDPDIINFSESPDESIVKEIAKHLDMDYVQFSSAGNWPGTLLTRYEIVNSENVPVVNGKRPEDLFTRHWGKATVRLPQDKLVSVHSIHLYPHDKPEARAIRKREIAKILESLQEDMKNKNSILVLGDLNHTPSMPGYQQWMEAGWTDTFSEAGEGDGLTINAEDPGRRIDYVLAHGPISEKVIESRSLFEGAFRTNPSDPNSFALSDHLPQLAVFETGDFN
jgi:endonuclease/exonuclease/phosphatase family metal-dependent hydrolase